jgi:hypothetical protein
VSLSATRFLAVRGRWVRVAFVLSAPARVTLTLLRGKKIVAQLSATQHKAGRGWLSWNGKIKGHLAPRGAYRIMARAVSPAGAAARDAATLLIT